MVNFRFSIYIPNYTIPSRVTVHLTKLVLQGRTLFNLTSSGSKMRPELMKKRVQFSRRLYDRLNIIVEVFQNGYGTVSRRIPRC